MLVLFMYSFICVVGLVVYLLVRVCWVMLDVLLYM